jgi:hypothetical protein
MEVHVSWDAVKEIIISSLQTGLRFVTRTALKQCPGKQHLQLRKSKERIEFVLT